jgi:hypothetical protein
LPPTTTPVDAPELDPTILRHHIIQNLHNNGISIIPVTVGSFGDLGPMLELTLYGSFPSDVNYMKLLKKTSSWHRSHQGICLTARARAPVKALLPAADRSWRKHFGPRWLGSTYQYMSPLPSARKNIGIMVARQMAPHLSIGARLQRRLQNVSHTILQINHDHPNRTRRTGRLPLMSSLSSL